MEWRFYGVFTLWSFPPAGLRGEKAPVSARCDPNLQKETQRTVQAEETGATDPQGLPREPFETKNKTE
jgi:hypothetical protein